MLEVLEHIPDAARALSEGIRVARRFVILSVPSKLDSNPEHVHLLKTDFIDRAAHVAGIERVNYQSVLNHLIAVLSKP
jgi:hypothetical protein